MSICILNLIFSRAITSLYAQGEGGNLLCWAIFGDYLDILDENLYISKKLGLVICIINKSVNWAKRPKKASLQF